MVVVVEVVMGGGGGGSGYVNASAKKSSVKVSDPSEHQPG